MNIEAGSEAGAQRTRTKKICSERQLVVKGQHAVTTRCQDLSLILSLSTLIRFYFDFVLFFVCIYINISLHSSLVVVATYIAIYNDDYVSHCANGEERG